jgi:molybdopterin molybdotransferase
MSLDNAFQAPEWTLSLNEALASVLGRISPVCDAQPLPLTGCVGRILAEDVVSGVDQPPFANSAMDGFACRYADLEADRPVRLPVAGRVAAGHPISSPVPLGAAVEIFTGAPMPKDLDTVVMVEETRREDANGQSFVTLPKAGRQGQHVRPAGEDFKKGSVILRAGTKLRAQHVAMAAAAGLTELSMRKRLRVGVFSTGDEVVEPGQALGQGQIYGSNRYGQLAQIAAWGYEPVDLGHLPDDLDLTIKAFADAGRSVDVVLSSGGVSVGGEDHVRAAIEKLGELHLWRLKLKPGKPVALGRVGDAAFIGLPGNPVSALVTLLLVGRPVLLRLAGAMPVETLPQALLVRSGFSFRKKDDRRQFLRAHLGIDAADGQPIVTLFASQESGVLSSMAATQGLVDVAENRLAIEPGEMVPFLSYDSLQA